MARVTIITLICTLTFYVLYKLVVSLICRHVFVININNKEQVKLVWIFSIFQNSLPYSLSLHLKSHQIHNNNTKTSLKNKIDKKLFIFHYVQIIFLMLALVCNYLKCYPYNINAFWFGFTFSFHLILVICFRGKMKGLNLTLLVTMTCFVTSFWILWKKLLNQFFSMLNVFFSTKFYYLYKTLNKPLFKVT